MADLRTALAEESFRRAEVNLEDAFELDVEDVEGPVVHAAYLAIYHAAKAVVLFRDGVAPKSQKETGLRFIELLAAKDASYGAILRYAESLNDTVEYDGSIDLQGDEADELRNNAKLFVLYCGASIDRNVPLF